MQLDLFDILASVIHGRHFPLVAPLLGSSTPSHVADFVAAISIDAIQGVSRRWSRSQGGEKIEERGESELDSTTPVQWVLRTARIMAALFCMVIGPVLYGHLMRQTSPTTTAALTSAVPQTNTG